MPPDEDQTDLFSEMGELDVVRHFLVDLHDDLDGKVARSRQIIDLSQSLGSSGTMLFGGETTFVAWREARWSFIHGNFIATVMLCQGLVEHLLAAFLYGGLLMDLPERISFAETLKRCRQREVINEKDVLDLQRLMRLRNPLSHFRSLDDPTNLSRRVLTTMISAGDHLEADATFAIGLAIRILSLPAFSIGG